MMLRILSVMLLTGMITNAPVVAQSDDPPASDPPPANEGDQATESDDPPSLDDLLGIEEEEDDDGSMTTDEAARRDQEDELQRHLNEAEIEAAFELAIEKMVISADLLDGSFDTSLGTQRIQEEIMSKLDELIEAAKQQQQSSSSSSSSSSSRQSQSPSDPGQQRQEQQEGQSDQPADSPQDSQDGDPPPRQDGDINTVLEESRQEWGNLPERIRDMLWQGRQEKFSRLYQRLTEEYYRRLAEEGSE